MRHFVSSLHIALLPFRPISSPSLNFSPFLILIWTIYHITELSESVIKQMLDFDAKKRDEEKTISVCVAMLNTAHKKSSDEDKEDQMSNIMIMLPLHVEKNKISKFEVHLHFFHFCPILHSSPSLSLTLSLARFSTENLEKSKRFIYWRQQLRLRFI